MQQILVRRYKNSSAFERDANRQFDRGYAIIEVNGQRAPVAIVKGTFHFALTGIVGLAIGGYAHKSDPILVTYNYTGLPAERVRTPSRRERMGTKTQGLVLVLLVVFAIVLANVILH